MKRYTLVDLERSDSSKRRPHNGARFFPTRVRSWQTLLQKSAGSAGAKQSNPKGAALESIMRRTLIR
jgi:hypothetical protein